MERVVKFMGYESVVELKKYGNGRTAIVLTDVEDNSPVATATINVPDVDLADDEVVIKNYSENAGILDALVGGGIVKETGKVIQIGYVAVPICKLLI